MGGQVIQHPAPGSDISETHRNWAGLLPHELNSSPQPGKYTEFSFQVINYSMGMKNPGRQSTSRNANYWEKLPKVRSKRVPAAHSLCLSEGDHKKLERKSGWCGASQQTKEQAGAGMGVVGRDEVVLNTQCFQTKCLIPSSNSCTSPSLYLLHIHISLTYILRAINNPE